MLNDVKHLTGQRYPENHPSLQDPTWIHSCLNNFPEEDSIDVTSSDLAFQPVLQVGICVN